MTAAATPTKYDPQALGGATALATTATSGGTLLDTGVTAERGTKIESVIVVNTSTTPTAFTLNYRDVPNTFGAGVNTLFKLVNAFNIPGDGAPVVFNFNAVYLLATAELRAFSGAANLDVTVFGIRMA